MTDVRLTTATMVLGEELEGRFFIRTAARELVVELYKPRGRRVALAIEPGTYDVRVERDKESLTTRVEVAEGTSVTLDQQQFGPAALEPARRRGDEPRPRFAVTGRNRLELVGGTWRTGNNGATIRAGSSALDVFGGLQYTRYVRENLAVTFGIDALGVESGSSVGSNGVAAGTVGGFAMPLGVRWNPFRGDHRTRLLKPFIAAALGPVFGSSSGSFVTDNTISTGTMTRATLGGRFGGGFDIHVARSFSLGLNVGYNAMMDFSEPVGLRDNFNGVQVALGVGWLFGKGY
jgi:hypothetical protein